MPPRYTPRVCCIRPEIPALAVPSATSPAPNNSPPRPKHQRPFRLTLSFVTARTMSSSLISADEEPRRRLKAQEYQALAFGGRVEGEAAQKTARNEHEIFTDDRRMSQTGEQKTI